MDNTATAVAPEAHKHANPLVFLFLIFPYGVIGGYVTVTFAYLYSKAGIPVSAIAALVGASILPQVFKFLWAPLVEVSLTLKKWYIVSGIVTAAGILLTGILPVKAANLPFLTIIIIVSNVAVSFLTVAVNGLAAHDTPHELRGKVGGYLQAGNLGGGGLGGGAGLWLAQHVTAIWAPGAALAVSCTLCCLALFFIKEHPSTIRAERVVITLKNLFVDIWQSLKARLGILALILCFIPLGTGAASNLWAAIAGDWHTSADTVALVTGLLSAGISAAGCLFGGWLCDRANRQYAYIVFGLLQAICAVAMAYCPHTQLMYITWTLLYTFANGLSYAAFTAFVLEAIGRGAAGTKYTVYASLSNAPIYFMTLVDGWAQTKFNSNGMLNTEAAIAVASAILFIVLLRYLKTPPKVLA